MKAINISKTILTLFTFLFVFNLNATTSFNDLLKPEIEKIEEPPAEHEFCINILIVSYCIKWTTGDAMTAKKAKQFAALLNANNGDDFSVEGKKGETYLVIRGFDKRLDGIVLEGEDSSFCNGATTKPGKYTIKNGQLVVPIINKNKKRVNRDYKTQARRMN